MEILKWDAAASRLGVSLYATLGASSHGMPGGEPGHRVEYLVGLNPDEDRIASPLASLGLFAAREHELVDHGHTVPAGGALWRGAEFSAFLVLRQVGEILPLLNLSDGMHVEFLQAVPLYESERVFKVAHGTEALMERWEAAGVPFWDPNRRAEPSRV